MLTHDSDFGMIAVASGEPFFAIVFIRPGHIDASYTVSTLIAVRDAGVAIEPGSIIVATRRASGTTIRVRVAPTGPETAS